MGSYKKFVITDRACPECDNELLRDKTRDGTFGCTGCHDRFQEDDSGELQPL